MTAHKHSWASIGTIVALFCCVAGLWHGFRSPNSVAHQPPAQTIPGHRSDWLDGIVPLGEVELAIQDLDKDGDRKLIAWSQMDPVSGRSSRIVVVQTKDPTKPRVIWETLSSELYNPRIISFADWKHKGDQVFLVLRNDGATWELADPIWIDHDKVQTGVKLSWEYSQVLHLGGPQAHQLVTYSRFPSDIEMPTIYEWKDNDLAVNDKEYPNFFRKFAEDNRTCVMVDGKLDVPNCLTEASFLARSGQKKEARALLKKIRKQVFSSLCSEWQGVYFEVANIARQ
ncbi:MAG TPA: hypothetical protein V6C81_00940 [Planktothrix sp.]